MLEEKLSEFNNILFYFVVFSTGIMAIIMTLQIFFKHKNRTMFYFSLFMFSFLLNQLLLSIHYFQRLHVITVNIQERTIVTYLYCISVSLLLWFTPLVIRSLLKIQTRIAWNIIFIVFGMTGIVCAFFPFFVSPSIPAAFPLFRKEELLLSFVTFFYMSSWGLVLLLRKKPALNIENNLIYRSLLLLFCLFFLPWLLDIYFQTNEYFYFEHNIGPLFYFVWSLIIIMMMTGYWAKEKAIAILINLKDSFIHKYNISEREKEIIRYLSKGYPNQKIAEECFISLQTVKKHIYNIYQKTNTNSRMELFSLIQHEEESDY